MTISTVNMHWRRLPLANVNQNMNQNNDTQRKRSIRIAKKQVCKQQRNKWPISAYPYQPHVASQHLLLGDTLLWYSSFIFCCNNNSFLRLLFYSCDPLIWANAEMLRKKVCGLDVNKWMAERKVVVDWASALSIPFLPVQRRNIFYWVFVLCLPIAWRLFLYLSYVAHVFNVSRCHVSHSYHLLNPSQPSHWNERNSLSFCLYKRMLEH